MNKYCYLIIILLAGCQQPNNLAITSPMAKCSDTPVNSLEAKNVKSISLGNQEVKESGIVRSDIPLGYSFEGKSGQQFNYHTDENICVWIYAPNNQLLTNGKLPQVGKYIVQVSAMKGQTTFNLSMQLDKEQTTQAKIVQSIKTNPPPNLILTTPTPQTQQLKSRQSPEEALINYYKRVNSRNYEATWTLLSVRYIAKKSLSYNSYIGWWNSIRTVRINNAILYSGNPKEAYVDGELQYVTNDGTSHIENRRFFLLWKPDIDSWIIDDTIKP